MKKLIVISLFTLSSSLFTLCKAQIITTIAGNGTLGYGGDGGPATDAELNNSFGIFVSTAGILYIADNQNHRAREVSGGVISTFAGNGTSGYSGNGGPATSAEMGNPADVIINKAGDIFVVDFGEPSVREVHTGGKISTFAGNATSGFSGDGGPATSAQLDNPCGLAIDTAGNIYISDRGNNRIRIVDTAGTINTYAGNGVGGYSGDGGPATSAELNGSNGIFVDTPGNLYIADYQNNRVRKVNTGGVISTIAGNGTGAYSGDSGPATSAEVWNPMGVAVDASGNVYIADHSNSRIRMINTSGIISTVAGVGFAGFYGDGGSPTLAEINYPSGVCLDASGNLYISDQGNSRIREVTGISTNTNQWSEVSSQLSVYPNPSSGIFNVAISYELSAISRIDVYNVLGEEVYVSTCFDFAQQPPLNNPSTFNINLSNHPNGIYFYRVISKNNNLIGEGKIVVQK